MDAFPYKIYRGDTKTIDFVVTEDDSPFDLSDSVVKFIGKKSFSDTDANAVFDVTCTLTTPASGECSAEIQVFTEGTLFVELEYTKGATIKTLKQWGGFEVLPDLRRG